MTKEETKLKIAIEALKKLTEPVGRFSQDPLQFAQNTIEDSAEIAKKALEEIDNID
jgi:hypothetical protein